MAEPTIGRDVDERAKAILATRLAVTGQPADSYSEAEYAEALTEAQAAIDAERSSDESAEGAGADAVRAAILATGLATAPEADAPTRLLARAHELIREQGYKNGEWGDVELQSALRVAVAFLEPEAFVAAAEAVGLELPAPDTLSPLDAAVSSVFASDKTGGAQFLLKVRALQEGGTRESPIYASARMRQEAARGARQGAQPDRETLTEHVATENILRALGRVDKRGRLDYTADEYVEALQEARGGPRTLFAFDSPVGDPKVPLNPPKPVADLALHQAAMDILLKAGVTGIVEQARYEEAVQEARRRLGLEA
jgi:hypothetical protein